MPWKRAKKALQDLWTGYKDWRTGRKVREAKRLASDLDRIRDTAGTKARWEGLSDQARAARARAKTPKPGPS